MVVDRGAGGLGPAELGDRRALFARQVAANLHFWHARVRAAAADWAQLDGENENLARAVWIALQVEDLWPAALALLGDARPFIVRRGGAQAWYELVAGAAACAQGTAERGAVSHDAVSAVLLAADLAERAALFPAAEAHFRRALALCERADGTGWRDERLARTRADFGWFLVNQTRGAEAQELLDGAVAAAGSGSPSLATVRALIARGAYLNSQLYDSAAALPQLERALALAREIGDHAHMARALYELGVSHWRLKQYDAARERYRAALEQLERSGDLSLEALAIEALGVLAYERDGFQEALEHFGRAEEIHRRLGHDQYLAVLFNNSGAAHWGLGDLATAALYFQRALSIWRERGDELRATEVLANLAECYLDQGALALAAEALAGARAAVARSRGTPGWAVLDARIRELEPRLSV